MIWYYELNSREFGSWRQETDKLKKGNYDGPASYLEVCENPGLPNHENIVFWVRIKDDLYQQYVYQENKWFKSKELIYGFYKFPPLTTKQINIDHIMSVPRKFLKNQYSRLQEYLEQKRYIDTIYRDTARCMYRLKIEENKNNNKS